jgi:hypothetical protein
MTNALSRRRGFLRVVSMLLVGLIVLGTFAPQAEAARYRRRGWGYGRVYRGRVGVRPWGYGPRFYNRGYLVRPRVVAPPYYGYSVPLY